MILDAVQAVCGVGLLALGIVVIATSIRGYSRFWPGVILGVSWLSFGSFAAYDVFSRTLS